MQIPVAALTIVLMLTIPALGDLVFVNAGSGNIQSTPNAGGVPQTLHNYVGGVHNVAVYGNHAYWADASNGAVRRMNLDGSNVTTLATGFETLNYPLHVYRDRIYYAENQNSVLNIRSMGIDGNNRQNIASFANHAVTALYVHNETVFWVNNFRNSIQAVSINGTGLAEIYQLQPALGTLHALTVDPLNNHIYFATDVFYSMQRMNLDGSNLTMVLGSDHVRTPYGIAVDHDNSKHW